jgi:hypothetical protein
MSAAGKATTSTSSRPGTAKARQAEREARQKPGGGKKPTGSWADGADTAELARQDAISDRMRRQLKGAARETDDEAAELYKAGSDDAKREQRERQRAKAGSKARTRARRSTRKVTKAAKTPVKAARSGTVVGLLVGSLGLVLLLNFLRSADKAAGFLDGIRSAIAWFADPTKVIEYKGGG